ncbi:nucleoside hydrolase [Roseiconus nitratireducens]|uniref:Nucleoside hydrolase n=1 Tax=Roseiconus nitratireducens TaxID=2605748 RepID=A0A5M6DAX4_9BACT|nr:nucleoside hydrolase [Roseiconus nitratireducens]KAA5544708.1 nucleoside hydrolase [Roseiconus nitratireducens]
MKVMSMRWLTALVLIGCVAVAGQAKAQADAPVKVIFDTDMASDCDDAGALAVLHALADAGEAEILAVVTNRKCPAGVSGGVCDVINTFYGRADLPIGTDKDGAKVSWNRPSSYTRALYDEFPHDSPIDEQLPDALQVYRQTLAAAEDGSVVICSVGALSNLEDLLESHADESSSLTGRELISQKVSRTVIMGGHFPRSPKPETNILLDPPAAVAVAHGWPGEILWQGFEVGAALQCGATLKTVESNHPVRRAFELRPYREGRAIDHGKPAHDQAAVLLAVRGADSQYWKLSEPGRVVVDSDGHTQWMPDSKKEHRFASIRGGPEKLEALIDSLMTTRSR